MADHRHPPESIEARLRVSLATAQADHLDAEDRAAQLGAKVDELEEELHPLRVGLRRWWLGEARRLAHELAAPARDLKAHADEAEAEERKERPMKLVDLPEAS